MEDGEKILIVGGVAGGASCAARLRRLSEDVEIILLEKEEYVSLASCGLPYFVGGVVKEERRLFLATPESLAARFAIDVRVNSEVVSIDRERKTVTILDRVRGERYEEDYDKLVLSPGASPLRPPIPGVDLPGVFTVRNMDDGKRIRRWIDERKAARAVVVGGGYVGLEMVENLFTAGLQVTLVERLPRLLPLLDAEMVTGLHAHLVHKGISIHLDTLVNSIEKVSGDGLRVVLDSGHLVETDLVVLAVGVRPNVKLAREAGLEIGEQGGIRVNERMQTSDPAIWAVGDAVEVRSLVTGEWVSVPLAGPAARQGRLAADAMCGRPVRFRGVQGTAVVRVFDLELGITGPSEESLRRSGWWDENQCMKVYLHPPNHAAYYPGAFPLTMKLLFTRGDGKLVGLQAVGSGGVDKRIDVVSMALQMGADVFDLEETEMAYAPQFGSPKDPVNLAGMIAANVLRGDDIHRYAEDFDTQRHLFLDVRSPLEFSRDHVPGAVNIPFMMLRRKYDELPRDRTIVASCAVGQRSYYACRFLSQMGYRAENLSGGYRIFKAVHRGGEGSTGK